MLWATNKINTLKLLHQCKIECISLLENCVNFNSSCFTGRLFNNKYRRHFVNTIVCKCRLQVVKELNRNRQKHNGNENKNVIHRNATDKVRTK